MIKCFNNSSKNGPHAEFAATWDKVHDALINSIYEVHKTLINVHSSCGANFSVTLKDACLPSKLRQGPRTSLLDPIASLTACTKAIFYPHLPTSLERH